MNDVKISIHDSIVQVLPNATKAVQNFYGDQFAEKTLSKKEAAEDHSPPRLLLPSPRTSPSISARTASRASSPKYVTPATPRNSPRLSSLCWTKTPNSLRRLLSRRFLSSSCCLSPQTSLLEEA